MRKARGTLNIDEIAPKPEPFDGKQRITVATIVAYVILILLPLLPGASQVLPKWAIRLFSNVGAVAFLLSGILMLCGAANVRKSIARVPWFVLTLICGVTVLVEVMDKTGGLNVLRAHRLHLHATDPPLLSSADSWHYISLFELFRRSNANVLTAGARVDEKPRHHGHARTGGIRHRLDLYCERWRAHGRYVAPFDPRGPLYSLRARARGQI